MDAPHSKYPHLYAIVRFDLPFDGGRFQNHVTVVAVFSSRESAEKEVTRLRKVNPETKCGYDVFITRLKN